MKRFIMSLFFCCCVIAAVFSVSLGESEQGFVDLKQGIRAADQSAFSNDGYELYTFVKQCVREVALGSRTSTVFSSERVYDVSENDIQLIGYALQLECPYELFWFDRGNGYSFANENGRTTISFAVRDSFAESRYAVNPNAIASAMQAIHNCQSIIDAYRNASDFEKLEGYKNWICNHVEYNQEAAQNAGTYDDDAWQIIWVFDNDDNTNVVCEGYAKAFQYLCDQSTFSGNVSCLTVSGIMNGDRHMWNLVTFESSIYLVDVTLCDTKGPYGRKVFFLAGVNDAADGNGYYCRLLTANGYEDIWYAYDSATLSLYSGSSITVSGNRYRYDNIIRCEAFESRYETDIGYPGVAAVGAECNSGQLYYQWYRNISYGTENAPVYEKVEEANQAIYHSDPCYEPRSYMCIVMDDFGNQYTVFVDFWIYNDLTIEPVGESDLTVLKGSAVTLSAHAECLEGDLVYQWYKSDEYPMYIDFSGLEPVVLTIDFPEMIPVLLTADMMINGANNSSYTIDSVNETLWYFCAAKDIYNNYAAAAFYVVCSDDVYTEGTCGENANWSLTEEGNLFIWGTGAITSYQSDYERPWHMVRDRIISLTVSEGITHLGGNAFAMCGNLKSVTLPDGLNGWTGLGFSSFAGCTNLTSINIPDGIMVIPPFTFFECASLEEITLPESVIGIDTVAFGSSGIKSIRLPSRLSVISDNAFQFCENLESITIPDGVGMIEIQAFEGCTNLKHVILPDSLTEIGKHAFHKCRSLESIDLPEGLRVIEVGAFKSCSSLTEVTIPDSVTSLGESAFLSCFSLRYVKLPKHITEIKGSTFGNCTSLASIMIPEQVTEIGEGAFGKCTQLSSITLPAGLTVISDYVFRGSALQTIQIPEGVTEIGFRAFFECSALRSVILPESLESIGESAFEFCSSLTEINLPAGLTHIGSKAFNKSGIRSVLIPGSIGTIETSAFSSCDGLRTAVISEGIVSIGESAFYQCPNLESVRLPESLESIGDNTFSECLTLTEINLPEGLSHIGSMAFYNCKSITEINLPAGLTYIGSWAFYRTGIRSVIIPGGVESIGAYVFSYCDSLRTAVLSEGITSIGEYAFLWSQRLKFVFIPESVVSIDPNAFGTLSQVNFRYVFIVAAGSYAQQFAEQNGIRFVTDIEDIANTGNRPEAVLPLGLETISEEAFAGSSFSVVIVPETCTSIGHRAFADCGNLEIVIIPDGLTDIAEDAFEGSYPLIIPGR